MNKPPISQNVCADNLNLSQHTSRQSSDSQKDPSFTPLSAYQSGVSSSSSDSSNSRFTAVSQDEIQKLISIHVHQELSKYPSLYYDNDNADNINHHKLLKRVKSKFATFASKFDSYPPFKQTIAFQNWFDEKAKKNKILEVIGAAGYFSILYPFIIAGIVLGNIGKEHTIVVFVCNILAIVPLSVIISYLTESLAELTNPTIGGLLNITFGNAIELIFSILALFKGQLDTVQGSMVGSWLATTQLILGCAFFFASFKKKQLSFNKFSSYFNVIFMVFSGFIAKMVYTLNYNSNYTSQFTDSSSSYPSSAILKVSRGMAVLHLMLYALYLIIPYQHKKLLLDASHKKDVEKNMFDSGSSTPSVVRFSATNRFEGNDTISALSDSNTYMTGTSRSMENVKLSVYDNGKNKINESTAIVQSDTATDPTGEGIQLHELPKPSPAQPITGESNVASRESKQVDKATSIWVKFKDVFIYAFFLLAVTVVASFNSDYLLDSLNDFSEKTHIPKTFITVILIPIFSNAAEHVTSIIVAYKGQMELAMNIAVGSAIQINFLIVPFLILIAAATKSPYSFLYENTYCETMFCASILASFCIWNGKAYFATGAILLVNYIVCAMLIYFMV